MQNTVRCPKITVSADGKGLVSQSGGLLLAETVRVSGLGAGLAGGLARWRAPLAVHDPGKILTDLAMAVALGGDCLADAAVLRAEPGLCGPVASDPVISRLISALAADAPRALRMIRKARADRQITQVSYRESPLLFNRCSSGSSKSLRIIGGHGPFHGFFDWESGVSVDVCIVPRRT